MNMPTGRKKVKEQHEEQDDSRADKNERKKREAHQSRDANLPNFVNIDNIRKQVNRREWDLMKKWPQKYSFLTGDFLKKMIAEEYRKQNLPLKTSEPCKLDPTYIKPKPSPPVPVTSSAFVGWRSSNKIYNLEFIDTKYISPKYTIEPPLEEGEFRVDKQYFIFLG